MLIPYVFNCRFVHFLIYKIKQINIFWLKKKIETWLSIAYWDIYQIYLINQHTEES